MKKIRVNKVQFKKWKDIIEFKDTNNFKRCSCDSIVVNKEYEYIKIISNLDNIIKLSNFKNETVKGITNESR